MSSRPGGGHGAVWRRALAVVVLAGLSALLGLVGLAGPASAHAVLESTDPVAGSVVAQPPSMITLTFSEPVTAQPVGTTVLDASGARRPVTVHTADRAVHLTPTDPLPDGTVVVSWRVISEDSHPITGAFTFTVGAAGAGAAPVIPTASPEAAPTTIGRVVAQGLTYVGILLVAGLVLFELALLVGSPNATVGGAGTSRVRRRLSRARWAGVVLTAIGVALAVPLVGLWQQGLRWSALGDPAFWQQALVSPTALAGGLGLVGVVLAAAASGRVSTRVLAVVGAAVALGSLTLVGHTRTVDPGWLVIGADLAHVAAGAVWLGGLTGLVILLARSSAVSPEDGAATTARFSAAATWAVAVVAGTGLLLGWRILGSLDALVTTGYGRTLLVKTSLVLVVLALAGWNRYRLLPRVRRAPAGDGFQLLRTTVRAEAVLLVAVLLTTGALTGQSPRPEPSASAQGGQASQGTVDYGAMDHGAMDHGAMDHGETGDRGTGTAAGPVDQVLPLTTGAGAAAGTLTARVADVRRGGGSIELTLAGVDGQPLVPVAAPTLALSLTRGTSRIGPISLPLEQAGPGTYRAALDFPLAGTWTVQVSVRTSTYDNPLVTFPVAVP